MDNEKRAHDLAILYMQLEIKAVSYTHLEEKRRQQRLRANLIGVALAAALVAAGVILGLTAGVRL